MTLALQASSDIAFTPAVKSIQARKGSREAYARVERHGSWATTIDDNLAAVLAAQTSVLLATASAEGQHVLDEHTIGFADFKGNQQFITQGNLAENPKAYLFVIDYAHRRRIKIWGRARVVEDDPELIARLMPTDTKARPEQAILFEVEAWDSNCPMSPRRSLRGTSGSPSSKHCSRPRPSRATSEPHRPRRRFAILAVQPKQAG